MAIMRTKRASMAELAKLANVSEATVSRAFNKHPYIKREVYERIMRTANEINYIPRNVTARKRIGIIVNSFERNRLNGYSSSMLFYLSLHCGLHECSLEIILSQDLHLLQENFLKAAITFQAIPHLAQEFGKLKHTQLVCVNSLIDGFPCVSTDDLHGMELAVGYLSEHGHKKIALILSNDSPTSGVQQRKVGFRKAIQARGLAHSPEMIGYLNNTPIEATAKLVLSQKPDAILIAGEDMAHPVNYALNLLQIRIPQDLSVVSYENASVSEYMTPPHTTIAQDFDQLASAAITLACEALEGKPIDPNTRISVENSLIERESVARKNACEPPESSKLTLRTD